MNRSISPASELTRNQSVVVAAVCADPKIADVLAGALRQANNDPQMLEALLRKNSLPAPLPEPQLNVLQLPERSLYQVALQIICSLKQYDTGIVKLTIPQGVSNVEAMRALNEHFRAHNPDFNRDAISTKYIDSLSTQEKITNLTPGKPRDISLYIDVPDTRGKTGVEAAQVLSDKGMTFANHEEVAIAAGAVACAEYGEDLFEGRYVRCSELNHALVTFKDKGVRKIWASENDNLFDIIVAGVSSSK